MRIQKQCFFVPLLLRQLSQNFDFCRRAIFFHFLIYVIFIRYFISRLNSETIKRLWINVKLWKKDLLRSTSVCSFTFLRMNSDFCIILTSQHKFNFSLKVKLIYILKLHQIWKIHGNYAYCSGWSVNLHRKNWFWNHFHFFYYEKIITKPFQFLLKVYYRVFTFSKANWIFSFRSKGCQSAKIVFLS